MHDLLYNNRATLDIARLGLDDMSRSIRLSQLAIRVVVRCMYWSVA